MSHYRYGEHQLWGVDNYVPKMTMAAALGEDGLYRVSLGTPNTTDADGILAAKEADDTGPFTYTVADFAAAAFSSGEIDSEGVFVKARFGRNITMVASGANTPNVTIVGYDYLGQKVVKTKAMAGATPVSFDVAIKRLVSITVAAGTASRTMDVGWNTVLGLPYKTVRVIHEELNGVLSATLGALTAPVLTDPATNATGDPRGLYTPNATMNGTSELSINAVASSWWNAAGNGGLHGIKHFGG